MQMIKKVNEFFIGDSGEVHFTDYLWFYGVFGFMFLMAITMLVANINMFLGGVS